MNSRTTLSLLYSETYLREIHSTIILEIQLFNPQSLIPLDMESKGISPWSMVCATSEIPVRWILRNLQENFSFLVFFYHFLIQFNLR